MSKNEYRIALQTEMGATMEARRLARFLFLMATPEEMEAVLSALLGSTNHVFNCDPEFVSGPDAKAEFLCGCIARVKVQAMGGKS